MGFGCVQNSANVNTVVVPHDSRIYVDLVGDWARGETARATVDGQYIGDAIIGEPQYIIVNPGVHIVSATTVNIPTTFRQFIKVDSGTYKHFEVPCDDASLTFRVDSLYASEGTSIYIGAPAHIGTLIPGVPQTFIVRPATNRQFVFTNNQGKVRYLLNVDVKYKMIDSFYIPYQ